MRKHYAVFGWNIARLNETVTALEKDGHFVQGFELGRLQDYDFVETDVCQFIEYTPDALETWKAKSKAAFKAEVIFPEKPPAYGEKKTTKPVKSEKAKPVKTAIASKGGE
jgi:hypothetical protein